MESGQAGGYFEKTVINGIDLLKGRERFTENQYLDVVRTYCKHIPSLLEKLNDFANGQFDDETLSEYTITVHGLKGASFGVFADNIGNKAKELEEASRRKDIEFLKKNTASFVKEAAMLLQSLEKLLADIAENAPEKQKAGSPDAALLSEFLEASRQYKSSLMEEIMEKLEEYQYETGTDLIQWLREQMDNLEYDAILERLTEELKNN